MRPSIHEVAEKFNVFYMREEERMLDQCLFAPRISSSRYDTRALGACKFMVPPHL